MKHLSKEIKTCHHTEIKMQKSIQNAKSIANATQQYCEKSPPSMDFIHVWQHPRLWWYIQRKWLFTDDCESLLKYFFTPICVYFYIPAVHGDRKNSISRRKKTKRIWVSSEQAAYRRELQFPLLVPWECITRGNSVVCGKERGIHRYHIRGIKGWGQLSVWVLQCRCPTRRCPTPLNVASSNIAYNSRIMNSDKPTLSTYVRFQTPTHIEFNWLSSCRSPYS